ncbi:MAG: tRNA preQ1(34) S-adenosylmethionine ribosyltransferase-isomerase QueA [Candidatus Sulfotelmatobacter sp.]
MLVSDFDFHLPEELIAQEPLAARDASRMLCVERGSGQWSDRLFRNLPERLHPGDLLVFNNTRVFPARLYGRRKGARAQPVSARNPAAREFLHGRIEILLTRQISNEPNDWECLVRPGRKIGVGERLFFGEYDSGEHDELQAEVLARGEFGERHIRFRPVEDFFSILDRIGHVPLPPYIAREDSSRDRERYQTVYAEPRGSVAAPTAGLHFTAEVVDRIHWRGVETADVTLHVGLGTFQPIRVERVEDHKIHSEPYSISSHAASAITRALQEARRIVAVGTTTVRTLEHAVRAGAGSILPGSGMADTFIYPGFKFQVVQAMLTNFHLPQSSLLMLVSAFGGKENVLRAYGHAVRERYRFYSYGDCMFIE